MTMTMAVLLSDSNFQTSWIAVDNKVDNASGMFDAQCSESAFLRARFQICGNDWGWGAQISDIYLEPWIPGERGIFFQIHDKDDQEQSHHTKVHEVKIQFKDGKSPAFWAIPQDPKERCEFPTVSAGGLPDSEDFQKAYWKAVVALGASPPALCEFISRGCTNVTMVGPNQSRVWEIGETLFRGILETRSAASLVDHVSSGIAPVLRCFRQAGRNISWAWGQGSSWRVAADEDMVHFWGRVSADVLWIKGIDSHNPTTVPLKVEDVVKIVSPNASEVDEGLVRDACSFIVSNSNREMRATIMATLAGAAFKTNNPLAVRLVGKECFNYSQISGSEGAQNVVSLAWDSAKAESNGLEILNETLRWGNADFAESMLQFAMIDQCGGCVDVLQDLLHVTGRNWSLLAFKKFHLYLRRNSVAFLRINATVPWICVDRLVVRNDHGQQRIGPSVVFGLQNFLQQLNMCTPPVSAFDFEMPVTPEGLRQLIGLETKLPKTLSLRLEFDGVQMFLQKLPLLPQLENLETLKLFLYNMDDAQTSTFCDTVTKQPSPKLKEMHFAGGTIHAEGMISISKMVAALPELERLDVSLNHIGDAGFEAFSEAMAPVASKSKLRFINVRHQHGNLGNLGVQALGKTLALLPALEEVVIRDNENITDEGLVGLLSPFVNKSSRSLRKVHIGRTNVSDTGVTILAQLMEKHPLEDISIDSTMITDEGLRLLGHALQNATCLLKKVQAESWNKAWSDEGVRDLLQGLEHCPNLVKVHVTGPKLSNQTIQMALKVLSGWRNLTNLDVTYGDRYYNLKEKNPLLWAWREGEEKVGAWCLLRPFEMWASCDSFTACHGWFQLEAGVHQQPINCL